MAVHAHNATEALASRRADHARALRRASPGPSARKAAARQRNDFATPLRAAHPRLDPLRLLRMRPAPRRYHP